MGEGGSIGPVTNHSRPDPSGLTGSYGLLIICATA